MLEYCPNYTCVTKQAYLQFLEIPVVSTDGYEQAKYFLCSHMPYPKKTNMLEIGSLHLQAIVVGVGVCVLCVCARKCMCTC